jgi:hypothetical protein
MSTAPWCARFIVDRMHHSSALVKTQQRCLTAVGSSVGVAVGSSVGAGVGVCHDGTGRESSDLR